MHGPIADFGLRIVDSPSNPSVFEPPTALLRSRLISNDASVLTCVLGGGDCRRKRAEMQKLPAEQAAAEPFGVQDRVSSIGIAASEPHEIPVLVKRVLLDMGIYVPQAECGGQTGGGRSPCSRTAKKKKFCSCGLARAVVIMPRASRVWRGNVSVGAVNGGIQCETESF